jgi:transposase-like protein
MRGATMQQIAEEMDVALSTIYKWRDEHAEFSEALNEGRQQTDLRVSAACTSGRWAASPRRRRG